MSIITITVPDLSGSTDVDVVEVLVEVIVLVVEFIFGVVVGAPFKFNVYLRNK